MERPYLCRTWLRDDARDAVLKALDEWAKASGLPTVRQGATDADLPELFRALDAQVDRVIERSGAIMPDEPYPEEVVARTRAQLAEIMNRPAPPASGAGE